MQLSDIPALVWILLGSFLLAMIYFQVIISRTVLALQEENARLRVIITKQLDELTHDEINEVSDILRADHE
ncbi:hypothetical protein [Fibrella forsythiae]|uniref:CcmD family protein n=1 Tax=Fibrella forsythiae TaxID=2817061 RepID=A0ABS3JBY6_9BACT|nr:hypothetical protein [Fibrella forsythiae]MBO0946978.1 hypothetical protein [Fibrella forsythiae]